MNDGPSIASIAALIGEHTRAEILTALMGGQALTATELSTHASVTKQTLSTHLAKLTEANLLAVESQGRHRYFRLADEDVARLLESLMGVAFRAGAVRLRSSPREPALRKARICYDHLAGDMGVMVYEALTKRGLLRVKKSGPELTPAGAAHFARLGVLVDELPAGRRPLCRACLDWSVRRHHLAGTLGAALLQRLYKLGWARRQGGANSGSRVVVFSAAGERQLRDWCDAK